MIVRQGNRYLIDGPLTFDSVGTLIDEGSVFEGDSVIVDFSGVTNADSSAVSLLLEWVRQFGGSGRKIAFANLSRGVQSLAELYGVVDLIPIAAD
jgi:phospholipid transport system transporter-binding protein